MSGVVTLVCLDLIITGLCGAQAVSHHMWAGWRLLMLLALISGENKIAELSNALKSYPL